MEEIIKALSDVMNVDFTNEEDTEYNAACGIGCIHSTRADCQKACDKWNRLAKLMGWKTYDVYIDRNYSWCDIHYVAATKEEAEEYNYEKVA